MSAAPMSLNLILGHSARAAISTMERCRAANTLCVVSPSPRAERRMTDEDLILTFTSMGQLMKRMTRMETHFYSSNFLWLPAKALTAFLTKADRLEDFLLNGVRIKGSDEDLVELGLALLRHPNLHRCTFFNIAAHRDPAKRGFSPDLRPLLEGASRNPSIANFTLRFAGWANDKLGVIVDSKSELTTLIFSGRETLYGPQGDGIDQGFPDLMESLKSNERLQELKIQQASGPVGTGALVSDMLRSNKHLKKLSISLAEFTDCLPIASALEHDNDTLEHIELLVGFHNFSMDETNPDVLAEEILAVQTALETALETNGSLVNVRFTSRKSEHSTERMAFYTRMNVAGRTAILTDDDLTGEEALDFLETNGDDTSMVFHMLSAKASILPLVTDHCSAMASKKKKVVIEEDSDSDDDKPIQFLANKARSKKANKKKSPRKRSRSSSSSIKVAARATFKRRKRC